MMHTVEEREALNLKYQGADPAAILAYACDFFGDKIAISSSFGADSACLLSVAAKVKPDIPVIFINTGFLFPETLAFRDELVRRLRLARPSNFLCCGFYRVLQFFLRLSRQN